MAKLKINYAISIVFSLSIATKLVSLEAAKLEDELCLINQNLVEIHFYAHSATGAPNATAYEVARAAVSTDAPFSFGKVLVFDDALTAGPGRGSEEVGKGQGIETSADMETTAFAMSYNVVFTAGDYNGSALSLAGRNPLVGQRRSLAVVGGTGVFRFARGYAVIGLYPTGEGSAFYVLLEYFVYTTFCPLFS